DWMSRPGVPTVDPKAGEDALRETDRRRAESTRGGHRFPPGPDARAVRLPARLVEDRPDEGVLGVLPPGAEHQDVAAPDGVDELGPALSDRAVAGADHREGVGVDLAHRL